MLIEENYFVGVLLLLFIGRRLQIKRHVIFLVYFDGLATNLKVKNTNKKTCRMQTVDF